VNLAYFSRQILATQDAKEIYSTTIEHPSFSSMGKSGSIILPSGAQYAACNPTAGSPPQRHYLRLDKYSTPYTALTSPIISGPRQNFTEKYRTSTTPNSTYLVNSPLLRDFPLISETSPENVARLDEIKSRVVVPSQNFDIDLLFQIRQTSSCQAQQTYRHLMLNTTICKIAILSVIYFPSAPIHVTLSHVTPPLTSLDPDTSNEILSPYHLNQEEERTVHNKKIFKTGCSHHLLYTTN